MVIGLIVLITILIYTTVTHKILVKNTAQMTVANKQQLKQRKLVGSAVDKGSGTFIGGKNILVGSYDVTSDDGEIIGNHTYSHDIHYKEGANNFVKDVDKCDAILKKILGDKYTSELVRFPGGSFDPKNQPGKLAPFRNATTKAGYRYINWNDETDDSHENDPSVSYLLSQLRKNTTGKNVVVVLMHDASAKKKYSISSSAGN